ncbi:unnamed protein product [Cladocopium goreaui]|uniref:Glyoxylate reductase n=1 Tax=Cladocopium goreaui TaxID=2562237 RepID=A0A9P1DDK8_9DINO|nr:unnamed protein product [Cladocopium goreaui]
MDSLDLDLESLGLRHGGASSARCARHAVILLLTAAVVICVLVDRREDGDAATRRDRRETALQEKYESSTEPLTPAPLETCIVTFLMQETCLRPLVIFMVLLLLLLLMLCVWEAFHCCCCGTKPSSTVPEVEQLINGKERMDEVLRRKSIKFLGEEWKEGTTSNMEIEEKIMRSWDVSHIEENLDLVDQVVQIMQDYPGLILHIKAFTITKLDKRQKSEVVDLVRGAFAKDFRDDFPYERMDLELAYAHGRVLSLKRLLGHKHISHRRIRTSLEHGKERKMVLELEIPQG